MRFDFQNIQGQTLTGRLEMPVANPRAFAIFAHCFTCSKNVKAATLISRKLADLGIAVLRFDFTGLGNSEGDFANTNFSSNVADLVAAAESLSQRQQAPSLLIGHSLGGAAVLLAAAEISSVKAVATIGAPGEPEHVTHLFGDELATIQNDGAANISLGGRQLTIERHFLDDLKQHRIADSLPRLQKPILIFHSPQDSIVSIDNARKIYEAAWHPKSFVSIDGADHMLSAPNDAHFVATTLAAWASRYIESDEGADEDHEMDDQAVVVEEIDKGLTQQIRTADHRWLADEPKKLGGSNMGPNPYDLLLAALGACTSMTLRMYAKRKELALETVQVELRHSRIHAKDCEECETSEGQIDRIEKQITVSGELTEAQLKRLGEIADMCPVYRTLVRDKQMVSSISLSKS